MFKKLRRFFSSSYLPPQLLPRDDTFDPFQVFEVTPEPCLVLRVTVVEGKNITKGWAGDLLDTPDPYVALKVRFTPNSTKKTRHIDNNTNPKWNETFEFYVDSKDINILDITVMDANYTYDERLGCQEYDLSQLKRDEEKEVVVSFNQGFTITLRMHVSVDKTPDLRYSLALCDEEKQFLVKRKHQVFRSLQKLLGEEHAPKSIREVPTIGILGSGGGFRAMVCLSGVIKALHNEGILDCTTFVAGLSGSAWYLSALYSHGEFPTKSPGELQDELKFSIDRSPFWLLNPHSLYRYGTSIIQKKNTGQPVSFTDFFGHMLGDTLLVKRIDAKLTDQRQKLQEGKIPFPLYTCLHVKKNVMAKVFQEWIEFTPYEVGIAKYGAFMKTENFGSKFYLGRLVKRFPEFPLHYLQGVWGSAFCILFRQLVRDQGKKDLSQAMRERAQNQREDNLQEQLEHFKIDDKDSETDASDTEDENDRLRNGAKETNGGIHSSNGVDETDESKIMIKEDINSETEQLNDGANEKMSIWSSMMMTVMRSSYFNTLSGRAASIFNPLRGLTLQYLYPISPFSPTTPSDEQEFKGTHEALSTEHKTLYLVDSGLTFNSPYPLLLRPQRGVELFLSFDFSARPSDQTPPFKEVLLAEKWALTNNVPFPPIEEIIQTQYANEPVRECYVFKHPRDPYCPIILHFVIINDKFKKFKAPGVPRTTDEEIEFGDFPIFDDPDQPYSLFNFSFTHYQFERISKLMEFNTLLYADLIKSTIADLVLRRRQTVPRPAITLADVARLKLKFCNKEAQKKLNAYVRSFSTVNQENSNNGTSSTEEKGVSPSSQSMPLNGDTPT